jgi:peptidoglycan/LPS O-acetylase OafA/YrhL/lysophospholipase L1-like esterase
MPRPIKKSHRYMPGMDGLRAIAVLAVIAYHLNLRFAPGGMLGVGIFFVLSGYLITDLLVTELEQNKRINLKGFWMRRVRRLVPALLLILIFVSIWVTFLEPSELPSLKGDVLAALLYVSNWWFIFHHVSYFASFGPPSPLGHLWSLAVEEQFYLLWPLILILAALFLHRRGKVFWFTLVLAIASALAMAFIYQPGTDPSRVYYGTDTRAFALLIGSALALIWPSRKLPTVIANSSRVMLDLVGLTGLAILLFMIWHTSEYEAFLYRGGLVLLSVATALVIAVLAHPASLLGKVLGMKPLRWIGVRSYGIYLWHYPVIILTSPAVNTEGVDVYRASLQVIVSILLAALSWKFVEDPIRRGKLSWPSLNKWNQKKWRKMKIFASISATFTLGVLCVDLVLPTHEVLASFAPYFANMSGATNLGSGASLSASLGANESPKANTNANTNTSTNVGSGTMPSGAAASNSVHATVSGGKSGLSASTGSGAGSIVGPNLSSGTNSGVGLGGNSSGSVGGNVGSAAKGSPSTGSQGDSHGVKQQSVTAIGDSVMLDIEPDLEKFVPGIKVDGHVGRQMYQAPGVITELEAEGNLGKTVVIELGTNGPFTKNQLTSLLDSLGSSRRIILVNTRVPRAWQNTVNQTLAQVVKSYPNATLIDWYSASAGHNEYFYPDGVHLNSVGAKVYATLVANAINR